MRHAFRLLIDRFLPPRLGRPFRALMAASWTTSLGDGVAGAAAPLLMASLTRSPLLVSIAAGLRWAPPLVFGLYAGVLSDRVNRKRIIIAGDAIRVLVLGALIAMIVTHALTVYGVLIALTLIATAEVFSDNTAGTLAPMLVDRSDLAIANSRLQTGFITLNALAGPPIGAALFAVARVWPFLTEAILVTGGIVLISRVVLPAHGSTEDRADRSIRRDIAEAFRWTIRHPPVRTLSLTILIFNVTFGAAWSVLVLYARDRLGLAVVGFGMLTTVQALGGLAGTGLYGPITRRVSLGNIMRIGLVIETLTHLGLALTRTVWVAAPILFVFGAHAFIWGTTSITVRQRAVPGHLQGRVNSMNTICVFGGLVIGSGVGGVIGARYGVTAPFWFAFAGSALFVVALWRQFTNIVHADSAGPAPQAQPEPALP